MPNCKDCGTYFTADSPERQKCFFCDPCKENKKHLVTITAEVWEADLDRGMTVSEAVQADSDLASFSFLSNVRIKSIEDWKGGI